MEELQSNHRKEAKDLQARITQKKKGASKKTRKGVNDECDTMERELKERQAAELAALSTPQETQAGAEVEAEVEADLSQLSLDGDSKSPVNSHPPPSQAPRPQTPQDDSDSFHKKPNRAKARLARRQAEQEALFAQAANEASNLPNHKQQERDRMLSEFSKRGLKEKEIRADGHCLYSAVADQMLALGLPLGSIPEPKPKISLFRKSSEANGNTEPFRQVRKAAGDYIDAHPDDFAPFLEEPLPEYVHKVRDTGEWGGQLELMALAKTYGLNINVLQGDGRVEKIQADDVPAQEGKDIWLAYYRHGFGLGEHYNSLHRTG